MPAGRILLKDISESKKVALLKTDGARILYTWLIPHLDVNGCYSGDPDVINGKILTRLKRTTKIVESYLQDLEQNNLIIRYETNGDIFLHLLNFQHKQPFLNPEREGKSTIPPPTPEQLKSNSRVTPDELLHKSKSKSKSKSKYICSFPFQEIWEKYPRRVGKKKAETYFKTSVKTDQDWKDIDTALNNYLNSERVKKGYIQNGCTWFGNWRDWINYTEAYCSKCKNTGKYKTTGPRGTFENYCSCEKGRALRKEEGGR